MIKLLKSIFSKKSNESNESQAQSADIKKIPIEDYFKIEVESSTYLNSESHNLVMRHLCLEINLVKTENKLSTEEKRELGLNPRQVITRELVQVLNQDGLKLSYPKAVLSDIYYKATFAKSKSENFTKAINIGVKKFTLLLAGDENECEWCKSNVNIQLGTDVLELFNKNCCCTPYSKTMIQPVIEF